METKKEKMTAKLKARYSVIMSTIGSVTSIFRGVKSVTRSISPSVVPLRAAGRLGESPRRLARCRRMARG